MSAVLCITFPCHAMQYYDANGDGQLDESELKQLYLNAFDSNAGQSTACLLACLPACLACLLACLPSMFHEP